MAQARITKRTVDQLIAQAIACGKTQFCRDLELKGFGVLATVKGSASYFVEYRLGGRAGRNRRVTLGKHGPLTPDLARKKALKHKGELTQGIDVAEVKRNERRRLAAQTVSEAIDSYLDLNGTNNRSWGETRRLLTYDMVPQLGKKPITTITRGDVALLIDRVGVRSPSVARALFAALRPFFRWAVERELIDRNPISDLQPPPPARPRDRILDPREIRVFWEASEALGFPFGPLFRLLLLTGQRRSEVAGIQISELDLRSGTWNLSGERTKNDKAHIVDLSQPAVDLISQLPGIYDLLFSTNGRTPPSGFSKAKRQLDARMAELNGAPVPPWRTHDLRRTAATGMAELGFAPHIVERVLNHTSGVTGGLVRVYQHFEHRDERRDAVIAWGEHVEKLIASSSSGSNVVPFAPVHRFRRKEA